MSGQLQLRRGTTAQNNAFTGAVGELTYNTDDGGLISHDGVTAGGYSGGGYLYAPGAAVTNVQAKLQESVSVKDYGAVGDGVANDTAAFTSAGAASNNLTVPKGTYLLSTTPTLNNVLLSIAADATLTGAGGAALGYTVGGGLQTLQINGTASDYSTRYIRRNATHTGGTPGNVSGALKVYDYVSAGATNYEWAIVGVLDNSATAGENVAGYFQGIKRSTGPTWGGVFEVIETNAVNNPATGTVGMEIDVAVNGTDATYPFARIGSDLVIRKYNAAGANSQAGWGYRIQGDAGASIQIGFGIYTGMTATYGFDTSQATILTAALRMAQGQSIAFDAASANQLKFDGTGLNYVVSGNSRVRLNSAGTVLLNNGTNQLTITSTSNTGASTPVLGANKPGATTGANSRWLEISLDSVKYWIPVWAD